MPGRIVYGQVLKNGTIIPGGWRQLSGYCPICDAQSHELWRKGSNQTGHLHIFDKYKLVKKQWRTAKGNLRHGWRCPLCQYRTKSIRILG